MHISSILIAVAIIVYFKRTSKNMFPWVSIIIELDRQHDFKFLDKKGDIKNKKRKSTSIYFLCSIMMNNPVGIGAEHIAGELNILADAILRTYSSSYSNFPLIIYFRNSLRWDNGTNFIRVKNCSQLSTYGCWRNKIKDFVWQRHWDTFLKIKPLYKYFIR